MEAHPSRVAREPADHHLAAEEAQRALLVRERAPDLQGQGARVGGRLLRILARAEPHVDPELGRGPLDDPEEEVPADEQVHHLAQGGGPVVDDGEVGRVREVARGQRGQESHHLPEAREIRGIDLEDGIGPVGVGLGRGQRGLPRGQVVEVAAAGVALDPPAIGEHPGAARGRGPVRARLDPGRGQRLAQGELRLGQGRGGHARLPPGLGPVRRDADPLDPGRAQGRRGLDSLRPEEAGQGGQPEEDAQRAMSSTLIRALSATPSPSVAAYSTCPGSRMMMLTLGSASRATPSSIFR